MDISLLVGLSILLAIAIAGISFTYSYYVYTKNKLFTKTKFPFTPVLIISLLWICLLIFVILVALNFNKTSNQYFGAYLGLSISLLVFSTAYILAFILMFFFNNKNKVEYADIFNINWKKKLADLEQKYGDMEAIKDKLSKKHSKYYTSMLEYYKTIVSRMGQKNLPISESVADIIMFNDTFTHKWSGFLNVYQLQLTYKFLAVFQKNPGQK